jgi:hypothetical protein
MNILFEVARQLQDYCDAQGWNSCLIGGIAVQRWGQARVTKDVDVILLTGFGNEDRFIAALTAAYPVRRQDAIAFARRNRVLLLTSPQGVEIDVSLGALPFEQLVVEHASTFVPEPGLELRTCSAEDLVVMKLFASRPIDVRDAETVIIRNPMLDWGYIEQQLQPLADAKAEPEIMHTLARLRGE